MKNRKPHSVPWVGAMLLELESKGLNQWSRTPEALEIIARHVTQATERMKISKNEPMKNAE